MTKTNRDQLATPNLTMLTIFFGLVLGSMGANADAGHDHDHGHELKAIHGGFVQELGDYHAELVLWQDAIGLHLHGQDDQVINVEGFTASVQVVNNSERSALITLVPADEHHLSGNGQFSRGPGAEALVTLTLADGSALEGRFMIGE